MAINKNEKIKNPKSLVKNALNKDTEGNIASKAFAIFLLILSIVYVIVSFDKSDLIVGVIDDFFIFMSAFCYVYAQFVKRKSSAYMLLKMCSVVFCFIGVISIILLMLFK